IQLPLHSICAAVLRPSYFRNTGCREPPANLTPSLHNRSLQTVPPSHRKNRGALPVSNFHHTSRRSALRHPRPALRSRNCRATDWKARALFRRLSFLEDEFGEDIVVNAPARVISSTRFEERSQ